MNKKAALMLIDSYKNRLANPVEMLDWTWLRVIILSIPDEAWETYVAEAAKVLSR